MQDTNTTAPAAKRPARLSNVQRLLIAAEHEIVGLMAAAVCGEANGLPLRELARLLTAVQDAKGRLDTPEASKAIHAAAAGAPHPS